MTKMVTSLLDQIILLQAVRRLGEDWSQVGSLMSLSSIESSSLYHEVIYHHQHKDGSLDELISKLATERIMEIKAQLRQIEESCGEPKPVIELDVEVVPSPISAQVEVEIDSSNASKTSSADSTRRRTWQRSAIMIFDKISDHRAGNAFVRATKEEGYTSIVKRPMYLDTVKSRIRNRVSFHLIL